MKTATAEVGDAAALPIAEPLPAPVPLAPAPDDVSAPPKDAKIAPSGIATKVIRPGRGGDRPVSDDCVKMTYKGWTRDGVLRTQSPSESDGAWLQCLRSGLPAMNEVLKTMTVGEERRAWIPAALAWPEGDDDDDKSEAKGDMTVDIALVELLKAPRAPKDLKAPPRSATKTASGLAFQVLKKGEGTEHPSETTHVAVHYAGWRTDGVLAETTLRENRPVHFALVEVPPGWREALSLMVVGEKLRAWMPAALVHGNRPARRGAPMGDMVYEFELLAINP